MDYFKSQGIPFYIINDWNDLDKLNEKNLETIYNETMTNKNDDALFLNYWINKIVQN